MNKSFYGVPVIIEQPKPRYVLPDDVPPPKGMTREEFNEWSLSVCGYMPSIIPNGMVYKTHREMFMSYETFQDMKSILNF
jgi:hypothetical protein